MHLNLISVGKLDDTGLVNHFGGGIWKLTNGILINDRIRNGVIRDLVKVAPIGDKLRETRLRWFGHVRRRSVDAPVRRCERINIPIRIRGRGRPKKKLDVVIREDLKVVGSTEDMAQDRRLWRDRIKTVDSGESTL